jgi:hypothetical protein
MEEIVGYLLAVVVGISLRIDRQWWVDSHGSYFSLHYECRAYQCHGIFFVHCRCHCAGRRDKKCNGEKCRLSKLF